MSRNQLPGSASPYLAAAADQPVWWRPWGPEAFEEARTAGRPLLLDIGAAWCHWCHVMDRESYEDPALADLLNEAFICIKVDRDEHPDVDARYQRAVQALSGQGGWPLTAFLTPEGEAFFGGTYFPPDARYGRPSFREVLERVRTVWHEQRAQVITQAGAVRAVVAQSLHEARPGEPGVAVLAAAAARMRQAEDQVHGGFGGRPKFPHPTALRFLLHQAADTGEEWPRAIVARALDGMARGGVHDQLGGGFHRYSVDERWIVPHFEKMASDNAELLRAYVAGAAGTGDPHWRETASGIVRWVREVLADPDGGYGASQDADVGLEDDGDYFTWTREEVAAVLSGAELEAALARWDIGAAGEMEHDPSRNVLHVADTLDHIGLRLELPTDRVAALLDSAEARLREARARRPAPAVDRTRYAAWNGMLAGALLRAAPVLDDPWAREHALRTLARMRRENPGDNGVTHRPGGSADLLEDQVHVADAAIDAFEATGDPAWLEWSAALLDRAWREHWTEGHGLRDRAGAGAGLLDADGFPVQDNPGPSASGVAGVACGRLAALTGEPRWAERRDALATALAGGLAELGIHGASALLAVGWAVHPPMELVVVGPAGDELAEAMHQRALATWAARRTVRRLDPDSAARGHLPPALRGMLKHATRGPRGFACVGATCRPPAATMDEWNATLTALYPNE